MNYSSEFLDALDRRAKLFAPAARATVKANEELCSWLLNPLGRWARAAYGKDVFDEAARGYARYCLGVANSQQIYEKAGRYTPESMPEIVSGVYEDESYMVPYMWGAILIYAFWPTMVGHLGLFRDSFLRRLPRGANVLEFACGHGVLSLLAAEERPDLHIEGADISPPAIAVANRLLKASGHERRVKFTVRDVIQPSVERKQQGLISAMLAEHLPDPKPHFAALSRQLDKEGLVFFSTAIESAQRDHVYEFHQESEPLQLAEAAGLRVTSLISGASTVPAGSKFLPRATAMILRRR